VIFWIRQREFADQVLVSAEQGLINIFIHQPACSRQLGESQVRSVTQQRRNPLPRGPRTSVRLSCPSGTRSASRLHRQTHDNARYLPAKARRASRKLVGELRDCRFIFALRCRRCADSPTHGMVREIQTLECSAAAMPTALLSCGDTQVPAWRSIPTESMTACLRCFCWGETTVSGFGSRSIGMRWIDCIRRV
jgi:hypothetical protein